MRAKPRCRATPHARAPPSTAPARTRSAIVHARRAQSQPKFERAARARARANTRATPHAAARVRNNVDNDTMQKNVVARAPQRTPQMRKENVTCEKCHAEMDSATRAYTPTHRPNARSTPVRKRALRVRHACQQRANRTRYARCARVTTTRRAAAYGTTGTRGASQRVRAGKCALHHASARTQTPVVYARGNKRTRHACYAARCRDESERREGDEMVR